MNHKIILISGKQGAGKDAIGEKLWNRFMAKNTCSIFKFASPVYEMHNTCFRQLIERDIVEESINHKDGELLQLIATWGRAKYGDDVWIKCLKNTLIDFEGYNSINLVSIITDLRFRNEFDAFPDERFTDVFKIRLECDRDIRKARCHGWRDTEYHISETDLDEYALTDKFDFKINTEQSLDWCVSLILRQLEKKGWF
jgi:phosphomevalonate kinase